MRTVRALFLLAVYLGGIGSLLVIWVDFLARIGVSSENLTTGWAVVLIPFMLATAFLGKTGAREKNVEEPQRPVMAVPVKAVFTRKIC